MVLKDTCIIRYYRYILVRYPRDAPATVLFGEWFRFGKPSDQKFLFEKTVSRVILFICLGICIILH